MDDEFLKYLEENKKQISIGQFIQSVKATISFFETIIISQYIMSIENHICNWIFDEKLQNYFYQMCYNSFFNKDNGSLL
jgi:ABC-type oligopeptide transport system substrate-binding subunit